MKDRGVSCKTTLCEHVVGCSMRVRGAPQLLHCLCMHVSWTRWLWHSLGVFLVPCINELVAVAALTQSYGVVLINTGSEHVLHNTGMLCRVLSSHHSGHQLRVTLAVCVEIRVVLFMT